LYRAGWTGTYEALLSDITIWDWRQHAWNKHARPRLAGWRLSSRWHPGWDQAGA
ncbi:hypothetical protein MNEG_15930, partial [Monoraphidium neglectum]